MTESLIERYLEHARFEKRLAQRTLRLYAQDLDKLARLCRQTPVKLLQVEPAMVRRWVAQMHSQGRSGRGIALILSGWRGFYTWLGREGLVAQNPAHGVRAPRTAKPLPKALAVEDALALSNYCDERAPAWLQARDAAMVELLYGSGLRLAELTGLDAQAHAAARGWVDVQAGQVHVLGKGQKRRTVPVGAPGLQAVQVWLQQRQQVLAALGPDPAASAALFINQSGRRLSGQTVWRRLRQRSLKAGLAAPVHPHMLRHSCASHVLQSSGDLRGVQELLGHASIGTTQVYTRLDFSHLAQAYDAAHPRAHLAPEEPKLGSK